jgi:muconate cycloisomerase
VAIRCDANQAWTPRAAVTAIRRLEEWGIAMIEQPVPADDIEGLAEVRAAVQVPVAADESVASPAEALRLIRAKAADIFSIKTTKLGGLLPSKKTAAVVEAAGGALFINSMIELGVSVAASLHFAVTCRDLCSVGHALTSVRRLQDDILQDPIRYAGAEILAPDATPGLGVALDEAKMRRYAVAEVRLP